jgi:3-hydroxybutyrate dehydrogenase
MSLAGRSALVTGSTGGLGYAIAEGLAAQGCNVVLHGLATDTEMAPAADALARTHGVKAIYDGADLRELDAIAAMIARADRVFGSIDIVVNNAVVRHFAPVEDFPTERWEEALTVNLSAAFHTIRLTLPGMRARGFGRIVNLASPYSFIGAVNRVDYVTSKTAILGMTRAVALETAGSGITCNAVAPGTLPTPAIQSKIEGIAAAQGISIAAATKDYLAERQPGGRFIAMEGVAALVVFLCAPNARDISGAAIPLDCGWTVS